MSLSCPSCGFDLSGSQWHEPSRSGDLSAGHTSASCPKCGKLLPEGYVEPTIAYSPEPDAEAGSRISHFELKHRLGAGGFGEVWLARDLTLDRDVALKLPKSLGQEAASLLHEARTAASLQHRHIVAVHEVGSERGQVFIASDYIEGMTLRDYLSKGKLSVEESLQMMIPISHALHYAHEKQVVHRDIKPGNILLNLALEPSITDFGIAKRVSDDDTKSHDGRVVGTAKYMSPEQAGGQTRATDRRADIYSLGVLLFEMLTGELPFRGNVRAILNQKQTDDAPSPRTLNPRLPRDLETLCLKCLERDPGNRYPTAAALAAELERVQRGEPILARPVSKVERLWRWCQRRPAIAALLALLFLSLSSGLTGVTYFWLQAENNAAQLRDSLYLSQISLTGVQLNNGDLAGVRSTLKRVGEDPRLDAVRGFEYGYYSGEIEPLRRIANHGDLVFAVAVSHDGDLCASIGKERQIRVWDTQTGEEVRALSIDKGLFRSIDFSPARGLLASASTDGLIRIWNPRQDARLVQQFRPGNQTALVRYSPNGEWLMTLGAKGPVRLWNAETFESVAALATGPSNGRDACFLGDGSRVLVASNDGQMRLYDWTVDSRKPQLTFGGDAPTGESAESDAEAPPAAPDQILAFAISDDETLVAGGTFHGRYSFWTLPEGKLVSATQSLWGRIDAIEFLPNSHTAAFVAINGRTQFVDGDTGRLSCDITTHGRMEAAMVRAANGQTFVYGNNDGELLQMRLNQLRLPSILWHPGPIEAAAFLPDGQRIVAVDYHPQSKSSELRVWNPSTGESERLQNEVEPAVDCLALNRTGGELATSGPGTFVLIRRTDTWEVVHRLPAPKNGAQQLEFSPLKGRLAILSRGGACQVYASTADSKPAYSIESRSSPIVAVHFVGDDERLAVAWEDGLVRLLDAATGQSTGTEQQFQATPSRMRSCEQNRVLAIATEGGEIHLWELEPNRVRQVIKAHLAKVNALACLPDGKTLVSGGRDRAIGLWNVATGESVATLLGHYRQVFTVDVAPDGLSIVSGGLEGDLRIWRGAPPSRTN